MRMSAGEDSDGKGQMLFDVQPRYPKQAGDLGLLFILIII